MPRRVLTVTKDHVRRHRLDTEDGRLAFLKRRQPDDHHLWTASLAPHPIPDHHHLVLDHVDSATPLEKLALHHPGQPMVSTRVIRVECSEAGCDAEAIHGASQCELHLQPPPEYR